MIRIGTGAPPFRMMVAFAFGFEREIVAVGVGKFHSHGLSHVLFGTRGHRASFSPHRTQTVTFCCELSLAPIFSTTGCGPEPTLSGTMTFI
jgi:hypothetical protein